MLISLNKSYFIVFGVLSMICRTCGRKLDLKNHLIINPLHRCSMIEILMRVRWYFQQAWRSGDREH